MSVKDELEHLMKPPEPVAPPKPAPPEKRKRTLGDIYVALEAQKIYDPNIPSVPAPAPANTFAKGVTPALDTSGAWGGPAQKGER